MTMSGTAVNQLEQLDAELETILTSFDTSYAWNYGSVKEGLRDLYEKAKRDQWNGTTQLAWDTAGRSRERDHPADRSTRSTGYAPYEQLEREGEGASPPRARSRSSSRSSCTASRAR